MTLKDGWRSQAACANEDPELFFPIPNDVNSERKALDICKHCPVIDKCLAAALEEPEQFGIWGGMTADARRQLLRQNMRRRRMQAFEQRERERRFRQTSTNSSMWEDVFWR